MSRPLAAVERGVAVVDPSFAATRTSSEWVEVLRGAGPDYERDVLVSLTLNAVPIDVLAERLNTTRGAVSRPSTMRAQSYAKHLRTGACRLTATRKIA
jgi:hypothetical protein